MKMFVTAQNTDLRLTETDITVERNPGEVIALDPSVTFQEILGFGGALTEAAGYALSKVSPENRAKALKAYFDPENGINYSFCRTHINSCDFSTGNWACCDTPGDTELKNFSLENDRKYILPLIKEALTAKGGSIRLFASPWSPPAWMKDNGRMNNGGKLLKEYYQAWADYFVRWIIEYEKEGVPVWGVTVQNEPKATTPWDNCIYEHEDERDFVKVLGPVLHKAGLERIKIMVWDHNKDLMTERARTILSDPEAAKYVWGVGFHWYGRTDGMSSRDNRPLDYVTENHPGKKLVFTEGCCPIMQDGEPVFGQWWIGEKYGSHIINDLNHNTVAWTDWNIVLDERGGPNHVENFCDAPIIADGKNDRIIFEPSYYYLGHFSRFILPGSVRIGLDKPEGAPEATAFKRPDGKIAVVLMNGTDSAAACTVKLAGQDIGIELPDHGIATLLI